MLLLPEKRLAAQPSGWRGFIPRLNASQAGTTAPVSCQIIRYKLLPTIIKGRRVSVYDERDGERNGSDIRSNIILQVSSGLTHEGCKDCTNF